MTRLLIEDSLCLPAPLSAPILILFLLRGEPSLCYLHDGDGICEDFERRYSIQDCGFFTPEGFTDQWATGAIANPEFQTPECPESVVIGQPHLMQVGGLFSILVPEAGARRRQLRY
jgi:hypothetical protein